MGMIDDKSLTIVDGLKFYKEQLLTGVAIQVNANRVVSKPKQTMQEGWEQIRRSQDYGSSLNTPVLLIVY